MLGSGGGKKGGGGSGAGGGDGAGTTSTDTAGGGGEDGGAGDGGAEAHPLYDWARLTCERLEECCAASGACSGPYGWGEDITTMDACVDYALGFGIILDGDEYVPACPGPDYDAYLSCIENLECGESSTTECSYPDAFVPC
jgi:hypothetical protein